MFSLDPDLDGRAEAGARLTVRVAGAESNVAIALTRLGIRTTWLSRLGLDPLGDVVHDAMAGEGVDVDHVVRCRERPTGVYFKWRVDGRTRVHYYRHGSAASRLAPADVPADVLDGASLVHLTGITMAIGAGDFVLELARGARDRGIPVVFDPNYREQLWDGPRAAAAAFAEVLPLASWCLCGSEEGRLLTGADTPEETIDRLVGAGARGAVVRVGTRGAVVGDGSAAARLVAPPRLEDVRDEVGAGDAFAAGFIYGLLHGWAPARCARAGHVIAARAVTGSGDWEELPRLAEVEQELALEPVA
jgi:sugar/nucleoside kinase (ribokinase family)